MKSYKFIQDFKTFAMKGNVIDMAVGVIVGSAFGKIVSSLVSDVIMPPLGLLIGGVDFRNLHVTLQPAVMENGKETAAVTLNYGIFLQNVFDFLIIACAVFFMVRLAGKLIHKKTPVPPPAPKPSKEEMLLAEIRDLLKEQGRK